MSQELARVIAGTLHGLQGLRVQVEVDLARTLPGFYLVGLPSTAVRESRERVGAALRHAGYGWPDRRITVNLAPADRRKDGAALDLAIALGILLASGQLPLPPAGLLESSLIVGELALDGSVRSARGLLALGLDAARLGVDRCLVPRSQIEELDAAVGIRRVPIAHLRELPQALTQLRHAAALSTAPAPIPPASTAAPGLHEIKGQSRAKRAMALAAAGGHHLLLIGPPGCGKTLLARRLVALLPSLSAEARAERLRIQSCAGLEVDLANAARPPLRAPHHTVSTAGLVGGGRPPSPGEITLAHHGVLFLDEASEFGAQRLDRLREPLASGEVQLSRLGETVRFPSRFQLVAATNPCPCGWAGSQVKSCSCLPSDVARYRRRLLGPLRDRIDLWVEMDREPARHLWEEEAEDRGELLAEIAEARARAQLRGRLNARLDGARLHEACQLEDGARELAQSWADGMGLSMRGLCGALRVARTIADLAHRPRVCRNDVAEALAYRRPG